MTIELTPGELDVLKQAGFSGRETARRLGVSTQTVKNRWTEIYRKMGLAGRAKPKKVIAITEALKRGIANLDDLAVTPRRLA